MSQFWRTTSLVLGLVLTVQTWRQSTRGAARPPPIEARDCASPPRAPRDPWGEPGRSGSSRTASDGAGDGPSLYGVKVPPWARSLLPQPGENLRAYRDRMIPLAQMAVAPHRARVVRSRDDLAATIGLDARQRAELDAATQETAAAIQDRLFEAALGGELAPSTFKPMAGVTVARDVLDLVARANQRFVGSLREDQRARLAQHPFDFADYLVFSTRWEDAISGL